MTNQLNDPNLFETRIAAFVSAGLDVFRIRAWTVIPGAYLRPSYSRPIRALLGRARRPTVNRKGRSRLGGAQ
jgi:hypothetical protein